MSRHESPEFSPEGQMIAHFGRDRPRESRADLARERRLLEIECAGSDAAWLWYPERPTNNPYREETPEHAAWKLGAHHGWLLAKESEDAGEERIIE